MKGCPLRQLPWVGSHCARPSFCVKAYIWECRSDPRSILDATCRTHLGRALSVMQDSHGLTAFFRDLHKAQHDKLQEALGWNWSILESNLALIRGITRTQSLLMAEQQKIIDFMKTLGISTEIAQGTLETACLLVQCLHVLLAYICPLA